MTQINYILKAEEYHTNTPAETELAVMINERVTLAYRGAYAVYYITVMGDYFDIMMIQDHHLVPTEFVVRTTIDDYLRWIRFVSTKLPF